MSVRDADTQHANASVARYVDVVVNTHIGDEATYAKFIQKNQHTDVASREKIQAIAYVENRVEKIGALFRTCQRDGHERVYNMCVMLRTKILEPPIHLDPATNYFTPSIEPPRDL